MMNIVAKKRKKPVSKLMHTLFFYYAYKYTLTIVHYFQIKIVMGPMEVHSHNDHPLFKYKLNFLASLF